MTTEYVACGSVNVLSADAGSTPSLKVAVSIISTASGKSIFYEEVTLNVNNTVEVLLKELLEVSFDEILRECLCI